MLRSLVGCGQRRQAQPPDGSEMTAPRRQRSGRCGLRRYDRTTRSCASAAAPSRAPGQRADRCWPGADRSIRSRSISDVPMSRSALAPRSSRMACGGGSTPRLRQDLRARHIGVEEVQGRIQAQDHQAGNRLRVRVPAHVAIFTARAFAQERDVRPAGAIQQHHQRQQDRKRQARHDTRRHNAHQRGERQDKIGLALAIVALEFL